MDARLKSKLDARLIQSSDADAFVRYFKSKNIAPPMKSVAIEGQVVSGTVQAEEIAVVGKQILKAALA